MSAPAWKWPLCLVLGALGLQGVVGTIGWAAEEGWSGVISVDETINGPAAQGGDQHELEHFALEIEDRVRQARSELTKDPPFIARIIREDIGFYQTELERIVAERGGALTISKTTYFIKGERMLVVSDSAHLVIDRHKGSFEGTVDGVPVHGAMQRLPDPEDLDKAPSSEPMLSYDTRRVTRHIKGHVYLIDVAPGLPNPYRLGLIESDQDLDLMRSLADLPGLPMIVSENTGDANRSLSVTRVDRREISDEIFAP